MNNFVSNSSIHVESSDIKIFLKHYREVTSMGVRIAIDSESGRSILYGFVNMPDQVRQKKIISRMYGKMVVGRHISIGSLKAKNMHRNFYYKNRQTLALC